MAPWAWCCEQERGGGFCPAQRRSAHGRPCAVASEGIPQTVASVQTSPKWEACACHDGRRGQH
eukprot:15467438-Alexandrium_andersonii.AAC.1